MQYRHLGKSGLEVSILGLGTNVIDTASIYNQNKFEQTIGNRG